MMLILGGVVLLCVYSAREWRGRHRDAPSIERPPEHENPLYRAFAAEFGWNTGESEETSCVEGLFPTSELEIDPFGRVVCPECGQEYRAGIPYCELCGAATVDEEDRPIVRRGEPNRLHAPLVCVLKTTQPVEATVVRSLLESYDIPTTITGPMALNIHRFHQIEAATIRVMVLEPDAERAREILSAH